MSSTILSHFPLPEIRQRQKDVLVEIESAIKSGYRHIFLEAPTGFGKCLKPDQLVFTRDGLIRIKDVKQGCSLTQGHALCDSVNMGKKKVITIVTRHGYSLSGAEEHRTLTFSEGRYIWKMLKDISYGDYAVIDYGGIEFTNDSVPVNFVQSCEKNRRIINLPQYWNEDLAYLIGIYIAEGSIDENTVEITNNGRNIPYINDFMCRISSALGINYAWRENKVFRLYSSNLKGFLRSLCPAKDAYRKFIPEVIFGLPKNLVISFLRGLYDGDGYLHKDSVGFVSASKRLCHDLQLLLLALGITSTRSEGYKTCEGKTFYAARLEISGGFMIGRFIDTIGIFRKRGIHVSKQIGANLAIPELNQHLEILVKQCRKTSGTVSRDRQTQTGKALHVMESYAYDLRRPTNRQLKTMLQTLSAVSFMPEYSELANIANNSFMYSSVKHIVHEEVESELFDFEAQPTHEYVAQGFVNHNSPVAIALARYLGSSHVCTATKDLQAQYRRDFPFVAEVKGRANFPCIVKEDMGLDESCDYGPCVKDEGYDCLYKTRLMDYKIEAEGTKQELVKLDSFAERRYASELESSSKLVELDWRPCHYFHQKWIGLRSSHTVYNYRYFLSDIFYSGSAQKRNLLVLDETHQLESQVGDFRSFTIHRNALRSLKIQMPETKVDAIETWIEFCSVLRERLVDFIEKASDIIERGNQKTSIEPYTEKNIIDALEREKKIAAVIEDMKKRKDNWIVSNIQRDQDTNQPVKATLMPLDVSVYFEPILDKGSIALFMSATILSKDYLCSTAGLEPEKVKFVRIEESDFPIENRPIHLMNVAWLNAKTMGESMPKIVIAIDNIMRTHRKEKGIIHTTSYSQLQFIRDNVSEENASRLIETGAHLDRNEVLEKHYSSKKPTVLISPSLHLGVDLKDDLSRFQVIVKVPYPDLTDKRVSEMKKRDPNWYTWNTVLRLVQAYGRSVRSRDDHATTYLLDGSISFLLDSSKDLVPKWFTEAIVQS